MKRYKELQRRHQVDLIAEGKIFDGIKGGGKYRGKKYDHILQCGNSNLFDKIRISTIKYFKNNRINWWGGIEPSGNTLSSQIACLNHLFLLRNDKQVLLDCLNNICGNCFKEVLPIPTWLDKEESTEHYIAFEAISNSEHLNENPSGGKRKRGSLITSIDAIIIAKDNNESIWIIPIEWKYTESYPNNDKSIEERLKRYSNLISESKQLVGIKDYHGSIYFQEPFYQLMRQTLWAEQVLKNEPQEWQNATKYLHLHIVPKDNKELLTKTYRRFPFMKNGLEETWKKCLKDESLYKIVNPKDFLEPIKNKFPKLYEYLDTRYWK